MSDAREIHIQPIPGVAGPAPVQATQYQRAPLSRPAQQHTSDANTRAATTGGNLRPVYAQVAVNPDTKDVIIRIRDSSTDQVLSETPSPEVEAMTKYLKDYVSTMSRHRSQLAGQTSR